jgi:integrase/recombinase XerD
MVSSKVVVCDSQLINLSSSLINEELDENKKLTELVRTTGVAVLDPNMKVLPMISDYLTTQLARNKIANESAKTYGKNLSYFLSFMKSRREFKDDHLDDSYLYVQQYVIEEYFTQLKLDGISSQTIGNREASISAFFHQYLCATRNNKERLRNDNPFEPGKLYQGTKTKNVNMCEVEELIALMKCTERENERVLLQFMQDSGVRRSEVSRITQRHIKDAMNENKHFIMLDDDTFEIPPDYKPLTIWGSKGRGRELKPRITLVSIPTLQRIKKYMASPEYRKAARKFGKDKPVFLNSQGGSQTGSNIGKLFNRLSKRALKLKLINRPIAAHMTRHGFAGMCLRSPDMGKDTLERLVNIKNCLGHAFLESTQVYTSIPYEIYGQLVNSHGELLTRHQIMERIRLKTKTKIKLLV